YRLSGCSFKYPSRVNVLKRVWFTKWNKYNPEDLKTDPVYAGRVSYSSQWKNYTLTIRDLRESDSAVYRFRFETNQKNFTGLPGVTLTVTALQVHVGRSSNSNWATLTCQSSCRLNYHSSYNWYKNGHKVSSRNKYWYSVNLNPSDSYSCAVRGYEDFSSPSVCLNVKYLLDAPKFASVLVLNNSHEIVEGSSVNLTCSSDANPAANYTWYKDKKPVNTEQQLTFSSIQSSDSGEYHCTAKNELGQRPSEVIFINIVEGSSVNLTCSSDANPAANYTWYKENKLLLHGPVGRYHLSSISSEDSGNYSCKAENLYGPAQSVTLYIDVECKYFSEQLRKHV
uniref:Ig-like domain-containing protein n=1 Tax=Neolamprologus brichardi TaxID=32507 RepID=A0A3Q4GHM5_NEOBR